MIIGIGTDLMDIRRIEATLARYGERFLKRVFTETERKKAMSRHTPGPTLAKRFAAKEACAKALGTGIGAGVNWQGMEVINLPSGKPTMNLTGGAAARLASMIPAGHMPVIHLALTDDVPHAQAFVIIEALPLK
jgi:holo-[acyl-carrier protein] synthase